MVTILDVLRQMAEAPVGVCVNFAVTGQAVQITEAVRRDAALARDYLLTLDSGNAAIEMLRDDEEWGAAALLTLLRDVARTAAQ